MLKIGERELTTKEIAIGVIFILVVIAAVWAMIGFGKGGPGGPLAGHLNYPRGAAVDSLGNVYVADSRNHRIEKYNGTDLKVADDFGSFGNATGGDAKKLISFATGKLNEPNGVAVGPEDNVYVIDTWNGRIQIFTPKGKFKSAFTTEDGFFGPRELVVDPAGFVYVADTGKHRIVKFDPNGKKVRAWGAKGEKQGEFNEPIGLAMDQGGNLYVADRLNFRIQVFNSDGQFIREFPVKGWSKEQVDMEPHLALDQAHSLLYATDGRGKKVYGFTLEGKLVSTFDKVPGSNMPFMVPIGVAVDKAGDLYVVDAGAGKLLKFKPQ